MKYVATVILTFLFLACQNVQQPEKPKNLIAKDKMVEVLTEAYLANAARSVDNKIIVAEGIKMDSLFYKKFGVDSLQFAKSNAFYAADANVYIEIFEEVESRLKTMEKEMDSIRAAANPATDTVSTKKPGDKKDPTQTRLPNLFILPFSLR